MQGAQHAGKRSHRQAAKRTAGEQIIKAGRQGAEYALAPAYRRIKDIGATSRAVIPSR